MSWNSRTSRPRSVASGKPGRNRASRPDHNRGRAEESRTRTRRRTSSFQIVARPEVDAVEDAVADFRVLLAKVGEGFKFLRDARWQRGRRRRCAGDWLMRQPLPL